MKKRSSHKGKTHQSSDGGMKVIAGVSLQRTNLMAMLVAVGVLLLCGFIAYLQYISLLSNSRTEKYQEQANTLAAHLGGRLQALGDMVSNFAIPDDTLVKAIQTHDLPVLRAREMAIMHDFPGANRVRFVLPGDDKVDNTVTPPLSYACLELAQLAEQGHKTPPFEVHLFGGKIEHLDMVRPVMYKGKPIASLIVTQDVSHLKNWLEELQKNGSYVELQQGVEDDVVRLFGKGDHSPQTDDKLYIASVTNSNWLLGYRPPSGIGETEARHVGFIITFAIGTGILIVFFLSYGAFVSSMLRSDLRRMVNFIIDFSLGKRIHSYPVRLAEVKKVLQEKENDLSVLTDYTETREAIHDKAEHFMPDISFGETGISVEEVVSPDKDNGDDKPK